LNTVVAAYQEASVPPLMPEPLVRPLPGRALIAQPPVGQPHEAGRAGGRSAVDAVRLELVPAPELILAELVLMPVALVLAAEPVLVPVALVLVEEPLILAELARMRERALAPEAVLIRAALLNRVALPVVLTLAEVPLTLEAAQRTRVAARHALVAARHALEAARLTPVVLLNRVVLPAVVTRVAGARRTPAAAGARRTPAAAGRLVPEAAVPPTRAVAVVTLQRAAVADTTSSLIARSWPLVIVLNW
jgi:hypothetical protein